MLKVQELREIIRLIDQSSISEFVYEDNGSTITIKKPTVVQNSNAVQEIIHTQPVVQAPIVEEKQPEPTKEVPKQQAKEEVVETVEDDDSIVEIVSPMVGTFYRKPSPESDPYVKIGDKIDENTIVCIVEAMKLFNEIEAEATGEIVEVLVGDGELVEYGQALFKVKTK
ncbi:acetyl-CoA carboxylase biotin carboxyl carrier protein [Pseudogracilibacillus sp. SE30717A]|uniref:acetyl-CoA carboxylase biotin carboxyl carrier protein n=1 Tax=Pseudogracilibacillus sp. SE30717A TaxID=3098293 RepID=UPI00300E145E